MVSPAITIVIKFSFSIETKVERLKSNLKKGIFGMDKALQGIREHTANHLQFGQGDTK